MLIILQELMYRIYVECEGKPPRRDQIPKPCDHFDLIVGTGTGGLIALMLGRLRLDLETCKEVYVRMTRRVFETDKTFAGIPYRSTLFKASKLEEAIRECVREHTIYENEGNDLSRQNGGRSSLSSPMYSPNSSAPQRSGSRASFSTTGSFSNNPVSQRNSAFINGLRFGNPEALLYDNRENRTKTYVRHYCGCCYSTVLTLIAPSRHCIKAPPATAQPFSFAPTTRAKNRRPSSTARSGKPVGRPPRLVSRSSPSRSANTYSSTKAPAPTTRRPRFLTKRP